MHGGALLAACSLFAMLLAGACGEPSPVPARALGCSSDMDRPLCIEVALAGFEDLPPDVLNGQGPFETMKVTTVDCRQWGAANDRLHLVGNSSGCWDVEIVGQGRVRAVAFRDAVGAIFAALY